MRDRFKVVLVEVSIFSMDNGAKKLTSAVESLEADGYRVVSMNGVGIFGWDLHVIAEHISTRLSSQSETGSAAVRQQERP